jgi:hypothetical protein
MNDAFFFQTQQITDSSSIFDQLKLAEYGLLFARK